MEKLKQTGRYRWVHHLARGGFTDVMLARLDAPGGFALPVAIKRLQTPFRNELVHRRALLAEARVGSLLSHANVLRYLDVVEHDEEILVVMEYLHGRNARTWLSSLAQAGQKTPITFAVLVITRILAALHHAHSACDERGRELALVHRDISPENVFLCRDGSVKLLDFGIARSAITPRDTEIHRLKGKVRYMSPEQARGRTLSPRSDIYSVGLLLYELLCQQPALEGDTPKAQLEAARAAQIGDIRSVRRDVPHELETVLRRATSPRVEERHPSARDMLRDLQRFLARLDPALSELELGAHIDHRFGAELDDERRTLWRHQSTAVVEESSKPNPRPITQPVQRAELASRARASVSQPDLDRLLQVVEDTYE